MLTQGIGKDPDHTLTINKEAMYNLNFTNPYYASIFLLALAINITAHRESSGTISFRLVILVYFITPCHWHVVDNPKKSIINYIHTQL